MSFLSLRRGRQTAARPTMHKLLATVAVLGAAASIAGLGTYATWTSTTSENHTISSGTVTIALGATGAATNRLNVGASALAPGDSVQRSVDLTSSGTIDLSGVSCAGAGATPTGCRGCGTSCAAALGGGGAAVRSTRASKAG